MTQISVGKLLPNLKVTVGNEDIGVENSESRIPADETQPQPENSNDTQNVQIVRSWMNSLQNPKIYKNKGGAFTTGLDLISEANTEMLDKRAERFGIEKAECSSTETISSLYENMGIEIDSRSSAKMKNMRLDALHMRGVNELNTSEIFQYFKDYGPASVEWINDFSCNVVWMDEATCARALLGNSKPLKSFRTKTEDSEEGEDTTNSDSSEPSKSSSIPEENTEFVKDTQNVKEEKVENMDTDDNSPVKSCTSAAFLLLDIPVPPGNWRLGIPHPKAKSILLRFATKDDKKIPGAEKRSVFYKKYGNPNYGGLVGLISSSRKRKIQAASNKIAIDLGSIKNETSQSTEDVLDGEAPVHKPKPPRMRMYADDEELKSKNLRYKHENIEKPRSVHSRLGTKYTKEDLFQLGSYRREEERYQSFEDSQHFSNRTNRWKRDENSQHFSKDQTGHWDGDEDNERFINDRTDHWERNVDKKHFSNDQTDRWKRKRDFLPNDQVDLRSKIQKIRTDSAVAKHRSPLCAED